MQYHHGCTPSISSPPSSFSFCLLLHLVPPPGLEPGSFGYKPTALPLSYGGRFSFASSNRCEYIGFKQFIFIFCVIGFYNSEFFLYLLHAIFPDSAYKDLGIIVKILFCLTWLTICWI